MIWDVQEHKYCIEYHSLKLILLQDTHNSWHIKWIAQQLHRWLISMLVLKPKTNLRVNAIHVQEHEACSKLNLHIYFMAMKPLSCELITCLNCLQPWFSFVRIWPVLQEEKSSPLQNSCVLNPKFLLWLSLHVDLENSEGTDYYSNLSSCPSLSGHTERKNPLKLG